MMKKNDGNKKKHSRDGDKNREKPVVPAKSSIPKPVPPPPRIFRVDNYDIKNIKSI